MSLCSTCDCICVARAELLADRLDRPSEAIALCESVREANPQNSRAREVLERALRKSGGDRQLATLLISAVGAIIIALLFWSLKRLVRPDPVQRLWIAFCRKLAAAGLPRSPHEGPRDFTERAALRFPSAAAAILVVGERYIALRYGAVRTDAGIAELRRSVREFRPA